MLSSWCESGTCEGSPTVIDCRRTRPDEDLWELIRPRKPWRGQNRLAQIGKNSTRMSVAKLAGDMPPGRQTLLVVRYCMMLFEMAYGLWADHERHPRPSGNQRLRKKFADRDFPEWGETSAAMAGVEPGRLEPGAS
jgi:hypothetical protein